MFKYVFKWSMKDNNGVEKSGITYYINDSGHEYKVDDKIWDSVECPNFGFKNLFYDREKNINKISFSMSEK